MLGILCIYSKKLSKRGTLGTFLYQNVIQHCGCLCCLTPQLLSLSHCESCMIHHCSCSYHNCHKCSLYHSILLWCSWGSILKNNPQLFLVLLSFQDLVLSSIITPDNLHLDLVSHIQSLYPINNRFNLFIPLFQKETLLLLCCFIHQHHPMLSSSHAWISH